MMLLNNKKSLSLVMLSVLMFGFVKAENSNNAEMTAEEIVKHSGTPYEVEKQGNFVRSKRSPDDNSWNKIGNHAFVPYLFEVGFSFQTKVRKAMKMIEDRTCVRFIPHTNQVDFVAFKFHQLSCASEVGKQGGPQKVYISNGCTVGVIVDELMHVLGFVNDNGTPDRDESVKVFTKRIGQAGVAQRERLSREDVFRINTKYTCKGYPRRIIFNSRAAANQVYKCVDKVEKYPFCRFVAPIDCRNGLVLYCPQRCQICERLVQLIIKLENKTGKLIALEK